MSSPDNSSGTPPAVGTYIDGGALKLVSVLGYGGYGVVYHAIDAYSKQANPSSYAVKCLVRASSRSSGRQRRLHLQEITLHQLASSHPHVVSLHRIIEEDGFTFIVMDYCPDGDLFAQILHQRRYLGHDSLIKHAFLQLLDAVGHCHSLGIYHRDLKPENVLCFNGGLRLALTDFGLATTDRVSQEFRTGSVYHMSPECHGGAFAPSGTYSPPYNDVWSLGIILLNLITGRNPWKSASAGDPTFQAYLREPSNFLPSVLPISDEVNDILLQTLDVNWRSRITLSELRHAIKGVHSFYSEDVVFEGSMARCPWEAGLDIADAADSDDEKALDMPQPDVDDEPRSAWSEDSNPDMIFATHSGEVDGSWQVYAPSRATWGEDSALRSRTPSMLSATHDDPTTPISASFSVYSPALSDPYLSTRPEDGSVFTQGATGMSSPRLSVDPFAKAYDPSIVMHAADSSAMHTALESPGGYASSFFIPSPLSVTKPSFPPNSAFKIAMSTYAEEDGLRQRSISWTQASYDLPDDAAARELSSMEFSQPSANPSPIDTKPWGGWQSAPTSPRKAAFSFPLSPFVSSPATSTPFRTVAPDPRPVRGERRKIRSNNFFLPIRIPFTPRTSAPAAAIANMRYPGPPPPAVPLPPLPSHEAEYSEKSPVSYAEDPLSSPQSPEETNRRRHRTLRSARNWLFFAKRLAAPTA